MPRTDIATRPFDSTQFTIDDGTLDPREVVMAHSLAGGSGARNRSSLPDYLRRMSKREQYTGQGELAILAKELQVNLRVYSTVGQVAEAGGGGAGQSTGARPPRTAQAPQMRAQSSSATQVTILTLFGAD